MVTNHSKALRHGSHSFTCNKHHTCRLPRKRSPDGTSIDWGGKHLIAAHYSFIDPERMKGWVGLVGWAPADGLPTIPHSGYPLAEGRAQDRVSSPAEDRRSANCATQPTQVLFILRWKLEISSNWSCLMLVSVARYKVKTHHWTSHRTLLMMKRKMNWAQLRLPMLMIMTLMVV